MSCVYTSFLGRHRLRNRQEYLWYLAHGIFIPFLFFFSPTSPIVRYVAFPGIVATGFRLTGYTRDRIHLVPTTLVFDSYGVSYTLFGLQRVYGKNILTCLHDIGILLSLRSLYELQRLGSLELFLLLFPIPFLHLYLSTASWQYLGMLGTAFSLSHDAYWVFRQKRSMRDRILLQTLPLLLLVSGFLDDH